MYFVCFSFRVGHSGDGSQGKAAHPPDRCVLLSCFVPVSFGCPSLCDCLVFLGFVGKAREIQEMTNMTEGITCYSKALIRTQLFARIERQ